MRIYAVLPTYDSHDNLYHSVTAYDLQGVVQGHFKFYKGLLTLIPFLVNCRLTMGKAIKLAKKLDKRSKV